MTNRRKYRQPATNTRSIEVGSPSHAAIVEQALKVRAELDHRPALAPPDPTHAHRCTMCKRPHPERAMTRWVSKPRPDGTYAVQLYVCLNCSNPKPKPYPDVQADPGASRGKPAW